MKKLNSKPLDGAIRWGILGCGDVTEIKSGPALRKIAGSALTAVMRRDADKARDYARRHGVPRWYGHASDLLADPEVDAVYVASPPGVHLELGRLVAEAGKPCYVEKPMGASSSDAQGLIDVFDQAGLPFYPAFYRRGLRKFRKVGELLAAGVLGKVEKVHYLHLSDSQLTCTNWRLDPGLSGGGLFIDLGSHVLDILDFWFGPLDLKSRHAENRSGRGEMPDSVQAALTAPGQVRVELDFNFAKPGENRERMRIEGEKGSLSFTIFSLDPLQAENRKHPSEPLVPDEIFVAEHVQQGLLENVMDCLRGKAEPWTTPQAALRTWKLMEAILKGDA
ncbi:MAG TPA: Gfo/Idh/MocA family oxidoreductase [Candidatus Methylacidiphilales bacterium]|nr:Gfo/Idh/MocA family oxidoreductase [Candidatus Methylacidiphilales bacterium]